MYVEYKIVYNTSGSAEGLYHQKQRKFPVLLIFLVISTLALTLYAARWEIHNFVDALEQMACSFEGDGNISDALSAFCQNVFTGAGID